MCVASCTSTTACARASLKQMSRVDNMHSRLVAWAKIILPLCGIGLLSTLFLFGKPEGEAPQIPIAEIEKLAREQRITAPQFSGVTADGAIMAITAHSARPDPADLSTMEINDLLMTLDATDGSSLRITAGRGAIDGAAQTATLTGLAQLETTSGYRMETTGLSANLKTGDIVSDGALEIRSPMGELTAGKVAIQTDRTTGGRQILFTQGVHLLYTPSYDAAKD